MMRARPALASLCAAMVVLVGSVARGEYVPGRGAATAQPTKKPAKAAASGPLTVSAAVGTAGAALRFAVHFDNVDGGTRPIPISYRTMDGSAAAGTNYSFEQGQLTLAPNSTQIVTVPTFVASPGAPVRTLQLAVNWGGFSTSGQGTINPQLAPPPGAAAPVLRVIGARAASGKPLVFVIRNLDAAGSLPVPVSYSSADGTASSGVDYAAVTGSFMLAAGSRRAIHVDTYAVPSSGARRTMTLTAASGSTAASGTGLILPVAASSGDVPVAPSPPPTFWQTLMTAAHGSREIVRVAMLSIAVAVLFSGSALVRSWRLRHAWPRPLAVSATCGLTPPQAPVVRGSVFAAGPAIAVYVTLSGETPTCISPAD